MAWTVILPRCAWGRISCDDQHAAEALEGEHEEVAIILRQRTNSLEYLLVLQPKGGQTVPMLVEPTALPEVAEEMIARSKVRARHSALWSHRRQNTLRRYSLA
jgi:hypothetical protein